MRFVRTSFLDVREGNRPVSGKHGGGRHGQQYVVLRLGARLGGGRGLTSRRATSVRHSALTVDGPLGTTLTPRRVVQFNSWQRHKSRNVNKHLDDTSEGKKTPGRPRNRWNNK